VGTLPKYLWVGGRGNARNREGGPWGGEDFCPSGAGNSFIRGFARGSFRGGGSKKLPTGNNRGKELPDVTCSSTGADKSPRPTRGSIIAVYLEKYIGRPFEKGRKTCFTSPMTVVVRM